MAKTERLDKVLSNMGYGTRKELKFIIQKGYVKVDGQVIKNRSMHICPYENEVEINGEKVIYEPNLYVMLNKPSGVISATVDPRDETVIDLLEKRYQNMKPFPVGRLDKDTEGLLILTNDGQLSHELLSPKKHVPKMYYAHIQGKVTKEDIEKFQEGVRLEDGYETKPAKLEILESDEVSKIHLTIYEGKFHQVKRMFEAVAKKVTYLKRISMGALSLDETLELGEYRKLTEEELEMLQKNLTK